MADAVIEVKDVSFQYPDGTLALKGINLKINRGSRVAILGPNGAGKSTLLLHFNGLLLPQRGEVYVCGRPVKGKNVRWVRTKVGLVFQDPDDQVFNPTVEEDVAFGPVNMGLPEEEVAGRVERALRIVGMWKERLRPPHLLSYGQKKRVAIAGVLAMEPEIIVLDEPMAYLDPQGKEELIAVLNLLNRRGTTLVVATHDVDFAAEWAEQIVIVKEGRVLAEGDVTLLADTSLIAEAGLTQPLLIRLWRAVKALENEPPPCRFEEAVAVLNAKLGKT